MTGETDAQDPVDPAEVEDFLDRLEANGWIADEIRGILVRSARLVAQTFTHLAKSDWPEHDGEPFASDIATALDERYGTVGSLVHDEARLDLYTVADTLSGYAALIATQSSFVGAVACARAVYESSVWAASVMDTSLTPAQRAQRALTRRLARLHASLRHATLLDSKATPDVDTQDEIDRILALADERGWKVVKGRFAPGIGAILSVERLAPTLPGAAGVEDYAWRSASSLIHGEQPDLAQSWLTFGFEKIPGWLTGVWTPGVPYGTRIALATASSYLGEDVGHDAWMLLYKTWDAACSQLGGWRL